MGMPDKAALGLGSAGRYARGSARIVPVTLGSRERGSASEQPEGLTPGAAGGHGGGRSSKRDGPYGRGQGELNPAGEGEIN